MSKMLSVVLLLGLAVVAMTLQASQAQSGGASRVPMLTTIQLDAERKVDLCVGESKPLFVSVKQRRARRPPRGQRPRWQTTLLPNLSVTAEATPQGVGSLSPTTSNTRSLGVAGPFSFQARKPGQTFVGFHLDVSSIAHQTGQVMTPPGAGTQVTVTAGTQVTVSTCKWEIYGYSRWHMPAGFQPTMVSTFETTVDINQVSQGVPLDVTTIVTNVASGKVMAGCYPTFTVPTSEVDMRLNRARNWNILISLFYDPVHPTTKLNCPGGFGMRLGDIGTPFGAPLLNLRFARSGGVRAIRHLLKTGTRGDAPGSTTVTVLEIP